MNPSENDYVQRVFDIWVMEPRLPTPEEKIWIPSNPELGLQADRDRQWSAEDWENLNFPSYLVPTEIETHVNCEKVKEVLDSLSSSDPQADRLLLSQVYRDLTEGCDSKVGHPGTSLTRTPNSFEDPSVDVPRILDALATEVKSQRTAGPFEPGTVKDAKVNGFLSIVKADGSQRQVGNMAAPRGLSFKDGIPEEALKEWQVYQTTAKQISTMIANAGEGAIMSCSDMVVAYKCLPVKKDQRRLQVFELIGKEFVDLRLVFGDKRACLLYDRFHHCLLKFFITPRAPIPQCWLGRTIDDVTTVAPKEARHVTERFVASYRDVLGELGIGAAAEDKGRHKAFDGATSGEVLGIWFDSVSMTWKLPDKKLHHLLAFLRNHAKDGRMNLNTVEIIHGKLSHLGQLAPPLESTHGGTDPGAPVLSRA